MQAARPQHDDLVGMHTTTLRESSPTDAQHDNTPSIAYGLVFFEDWINLLSETMPKTRCCLIIFYRSTEGLLPCHAGNCCTCPHATQEPIRIGAMYIQVMVVYVENVGIHVEVVPESVRRAQILIFGRDHDARSLELQTKAAASPLALEIREVFNASLQTTCGL